MAAVHSDAPVLVTGGTGLIGSYVARRLSQEGVTPVLFDLVPNHANIADVEEHVIVERGDICDTADLLRVAQKHSVESIIHLAAYTSFDTHSKPIRAVEVNCIGTGRVFELADRLGLRRVVWASTIGVYDRRAFYERLLGRDVLTEDDPAHPPELYGATKYLSEVMADHFAATRGVDIVALRPTMIFGPGRFEGATGVLNTAMRDVAVHGHAKVTYPWRPEVQVNPIYVKDSADLFVQTCLRQQPMTRNVYNTGTGERYRVSEMMKIVTGLVSGSSVEFDVTPSPDDGSSYVTDLDFSDFDSSPLRSELEWTAQYDFESAASECISVYRQTS